MSVNLFETTHNPKRKGVCFNLDATEEKIMDVQKHQSKQAERSTSVKECLSEKSVLTEDHIFRGTLKKVEH